MLCKLAFQRIQLNTTMAARTLRGVRAARRRRAPPPPPLRGAIGGDECTDPFAWLERGDDVALEYLAEEEAYARAWRRDSKALQHRFRRELRALVPAEESVSSGVEDIGEWSYYARARPGDELQVYCRRRRDGAAREEVILDPNALLRDGDHDSLSVGGLAMSNDGRFVAYIIDTAGGEDFALHVRDLESGATSAGALIRGVGSFEWEPPNPGGGHALVHAAVDDAGRPSRVLRTEIVVNAAGAPCTEAPTLLLEEHDRAFFADVRLTKDRSLVALTLRSKRATEAWLYAGRDGGASSTTRVMARAAGIEYQVERSGELYFMYRYISHESCSQFDSLPLTSLTVRWIRGVCLRGRQYVARARSGDGGGDGGGGPRARGAPRAARRAPCRVVGLGARRSRAERR